MFNFFRRKHKPYIIIKSTPIDPDTLSEEEREVLLEQKRLLDEGGMETVIEYGPQGTPIHIPTNILDYWDSIPPKGRAEIVEDMESTVLEVKRQRERRENEI